MSWFHWAKRHPFISITSVIGFILVAQIVVIIAGTSQNKVSVEQSVKQVTLSEDQCQSLLSQFYSFVADKPFDKTQLAKEVLEQYFDDAGLPVNKSNPGVRYELPSSKCGSTLDELLKVITAGQQRGA